MNANNSNKTTKKIGRNDRCSCGSGKKYKICCLTKRNSDVQICQICEKGKIINNFCKLCSDIKASGIIVYGDAFKTKSESMKHKRTVFESLGRIYSLKDINEIKNIIAPRIIEKEMLSQSKLFDYPVNRDSVQHSSVMIGGEGGNYAKCRTCKKILNHGKVECMVNVPTLIMSPN